MHSLKCLTVFVLTGTLAFQLYAPYYRPSLSPVPYYRPSVSPVPDTARTAAPQALPDQRPFAPGPVLSLHSPRLSGGTATYTSTDNAEIQVLPRLHSAPSVRLSPRPSRQHFPRVACVYNATPSPLFVIGSFKDARAAKDQIQRGHVNYIKLPNGDITYQDLLHATATIQATEVVLLDPAAHVNEYSSLISQPRKEDGSDGCGMRVADRLAVVSIIAHTCTPEARASSSSSSRSEKSYVAVCTDRALLAPLAHRSCTAYTNMTVQDGEGDDATPILHGCYIVTQNDEGRLAVTRRPLSK